MNEKLVNLKEKLVTDPFNSELRKQYADGLFAHEFWNDSRQQYELLISQGSTLAELRTRVALCHYHLENRDDALKMYQEASGFDGFEKSTVLEKLSESALPGGEIEMSPAGDEVDFDIPEEKATMDAPRRWEKITFDDIAGMTALKKQLRLHIIEPFLRPGLFAKFRKRAGEGILLYGPPGCGKTMIAKAIAAECNAHYESVGISDILNKWIGESERNLAHIFDKARTMKPSVLFFDELDALAFARSKARSESSRSVVNEFLAQLDGTAGINEELLILSATNMPWDVDSAMKRPGRFSRQIFVSPPDKEAREAIIRLKLKDVPCENINERELASNLEHYSGADIDGLIELAKEYVLSDIIETGVERPITQKDLLMASQEMTPSTLEWLKTARNLIKYAGADDTYKDVKTYLKKCKML